MPTTIKQINLKSGQRAERKQLITVAEWEEPLSGTTGTEQVREIIGVRIEESAIAMNSDVQENTDILGQNHTDVNKTQPTQDFNSFNILGGSRLAAYLIDNFRRNAVSELSGAFTIYVITAFLGDEQNGYEAIKQEECTITYDNLGGDSYVNMDITVHYSNKNTTGSVDKLTPDFAFTADVTV